MSGSKVSQGTKRWAQHLARQAVSKGQISKASSCERCGAEGETHGHHADYSRPLDVEWLCRVCHGREHRSEPTWLERARELRAQGLSYQKIAAEVGVAWSTAHKRLNPEAAERYNRTGNRSKSRKTKREAQQRQNRQEARRGRCQRCGGLMGISVTWDGTCRPCRKIQSHERALVVVEMWARGCSMAEIGTALSWSEETVGAMMRFYRKQGYDLPLRVTPRNSVPRNA